MHGPALYDLPDAAVDDHLDAALRELLSASFPKDPGFRVHRHWKEPPLHRWILRDDDAGGAALVAHAAVHRKIVGSEAGDLLVGGLAEVCVRVDHRGRGHVRQMLAGVHAWLDAQGYAFAMLFGDTSVYASSGYANVDNPIRYRDDDGRWVEQPMKGAMVRPVRRSDWPDGVIDLRGPLF